MRLHQEELEDIIYDQPTGVTSSKGRMETSNIIFAIDAQKNIVWV